MDLGGGTKTWVSTKDVDDEDDDEGTDELCCCFCGCCCSAWSVSILFDAARLPDIKGVLVDLDCLNYQHRLILVQV